MGEPPEWTSVFPDRSWRCCYLESGEPKMRFTKQEARRIVERMKRQGTVMNAYKCPLACGAWHIGHER